MNFTREPIIETIITPKEGYKLVLRNSKGGGKQEEYVVDAIEVVSFGHSFFFRSLERPKSFLVPVSDYEVVETKETRVVLKNATFEKAIKIGGGREAPVKAKEEKPSEEEEQAPAAVEQRLEKKRERRRHRRRRAAPKEEEEAKKQPEEKPAKEEAAAEGGGADDETKVSSSMLRRLIPPPQGLISEKIPKEKPKAPETTEGDVLPEPIKEVKEPEEKPKQTRKKKSAPKEKEEETPDSESQEMQRVTMEEAVTSNSFSSVERNFPPFGKIW